jgi:AcrR family transcriptional regulator
VSPRGVAIPDVREQLFAAAERVLARSGPSGLTSRAVTDEARCAKGVLHNHFGDLDGFLTALVIDRSRRLASSAQGLVALAGHSTVADNLTDAAKSLFGSTAAAISSLVVSRPSLALRLRDEHSTVEPVLGEIQDAFAAYLDAEKDLGRVAAGADTATLAFTLFASAHHLFSTQVGRPIARDQMRQIVTSLLAGVTNTQAR